MKLHFRGEAGWAPRPIIENSDNGHWVAIDELDGRNEADKIFASEYSGQVVLLIQS